MRKTQPHFPDFFLERIELLERGMGKMEDKIEKKLGRVCTKQVWANTKNCSACWDCVNTCPQGAIGRVRFFLHRHIVFKNPLACTGCKKCIKTCQKGVFNEI
jgi:2-oxoglutarate ferredoxin oxidoreductase subunit delta